MFVGIILGVDIFAVILALVEWVIISKLLNRLLIKEQIAPLFAVKEPDISPVVPEKKRGKLAFSLPVLD